METQTLGPCGLTWNGRYRMMTILSNRGRAIALAGLALCMGWVNVFAQEAEIVSEAGESFEPPKIKSIQAPGVDRALYIVEFEAPSIGRTTKYMVLLPDNYDETEYHYPVLYLLHGYSQNYTVWPMMGAGEATQGMDLIVVMPDAGNSWYVNWVESEGDEKNNWEDFIVKDLISHVDRVFRTIPLRGGRAINGLSMGGYGALTLGLRHYEMFASVGSHSGALTHARGMRARIESGYVPEIQVAPDGTDTVKDDGVPDAIRIEGFTRQSERYPRAIKFKTVEDCNSYDPFELIKVVPPRYLPHLYIDCGLNDSLLSSSQEFVMQLMSQGIPVTYSQTPGGHNPSYWRREIFQSVAVQYNFMRRQLLSQQAPATPEVEEPAPE